MEEKVIKPLPTLSLFWKLMLIVSLFQFAVAQPILDLLGTTPAFFVAHDSHVVEVLLFTVLVTFVLPLVWVAVVWLTHFLHGGLFRGVLLLTLTALIFVIALPHTHFLEQYQRQFSVLFALGVALLCVVVLTRSPFLQDYSKYLALAVVLVPLNFLLLSPAGKLILPSPGRAESPAVKITTTKDTPVILLVFDALPRASLMTADGSIDRERYPGLAALASSSTWYRNAVSVSDSTFNAVPSILTGVKPLPGLMPTAEDHPNNLFVYFRDTLEQFVYEPLTNLCPPDVLPGYVQPTFSERFTLLLDDSAIVYLHYLLPEFLRRNQPPIGEHWKNFRKETADGDSGSVHDATHHGKRVLETAAEDVVAIFNANIAHIKPREHAAFYFQHLMIPHVPWKYLPSGQQYEIRNRTGINDQGVWLDDEWLVTQAYQRHLLQLGAVDRLVARLIAHLRDQNLFDKAMVIVTADHGASFQSGLKKRTLQLENRADVASVPLFVKYPGQAGPRVVDRLVSTLDIAPTIATELTLSLPGSFDGNDLRANKGEATTSALLHRGGKPYTEITLQYLQRIRQQRVARKERLFPTRGHGPDDWFYPYSELDLVGQPVEEIASTPKNPALRASVWKKSIFRDVRLDQKSLPVRIMGGIVGAQISDPPLALAIALNGRIAAISRSYASGESVYYSAMLPPEFLHSGDNTVVTYAIHTRDSADVLISRLSD